MGTRQTRGHPADAIDGVRAVAPAKGFCRG
jgi:hypothetical protein